MECILFPKQHLKGSEKKTNQRERFVCVWSPTNPQNSWLPWAASCSQTRDISIISSQQCLAYAKSNSPFLPHHFILLSELRNPSHAFHHAAQPSCPTDFFGKFSNPKIIKNIFVKNRWPLFSFNPLFLTFWTYVPAKTHILMYNRPTNNTIYHLSGEKTPRKPWNGVGNRKIWNHSVRIENNPFETST